MVNDYSYYLRDPGGRIKTDGELVVVASSLPIGPFRRFWHLQLTDMVGYNNNNLV